MSSIPEEDRVKKLPAPHTIHIPFTWNWNVVTPAVYRYENQKWIDEFFETGRMRLSTFAKFATYPDEARRDRNEGKGICYGETHDGKSIFIAQAQGMNAAVLCCSHRLDHKLRESFERDSAFQIMNTVRFGVEIARQLPGFRHGWEGSCIYRHDRNEPQIKRDIDIDIEKYQRPDKTIDMQFAIDAGQALGGAELVLLKRKQYEGQQEYRILWELDTVRGEFIDVVAPNARQFCRKVDAADY
jgi:Protein of unknown function (DUF2971)